MRNMMTALFAGVGMGLLVGGVLAMFGSIFQHGTRVIDYLGPFNGDWDPDKVRFLGAILASIGSALLTFNLLVRRKL